MGSQIPSWRPSKFGEIVSHAATLSYSFDPLNNSFHNTYSVSHTNLVATTPSRNNKNNAIHHGLHRKSLDKNLNAQPCQPYSIPITHILRLPRNLFSPSLTHL